MKARSVDLPPPARVHKQRDSARSEPSGLDSCDLTETLLALADESPQESSHPGTVAGRSLNRLRDQTGATAAVFWSVLDGAARLVRSVGEADTLPETVQLGPDSITLERLSRNGAVTCGVGEVSGVEDLVPAGLKSYIAAAATEQGAVTAVLVLGWTTDTPPCSSKQSDHIRLAASLLSRAVLRPAVLSHPSTSLDAMDSSVTDRVAVLDREGVIVAVNAAWAASATLDGLVTGAGIGVNYLDVCRRSAVRGSPDAARALDGITRVCSGAAQSFELAYECAPPGQYRWWLLRAAPLRRPEGGAIVSHAEVTGATTAELERILGEEHFRSLTDAVPVPIFTLDPAGHIRFGNGAWKDVTGDRIPVGASWTDAAHPEDRGRAAKAFQEAATQRNGFDVDLRFHQSDGTFRWWGVTAVPHYDPNGDTRGFVVTCRDVTAARHLQQALHDAGARLIASQEAVRSRIARELHDDLGQQVVMLATRLDMVMNQEKVPTKELRAVVTQTQQGLQELGRAVHSLSHELHPAKLRLLGLQRTIAGLGRDLAAGTNVDVAFTSDGPIDHLGDDRALCIFRIAQEALQNALKHSGARRVDIGLAGSPSHISLRVADDGVGFDSVSLSTGLGLLTMRERVELIGGTLRIHTAPSGGTVIEATVPVNVESSETV